MSESLNIYTGLGLTQAPPRSAALTAALEVEAQATSLVEYRSAGHLLIIGSEVDALECAERLRTGLTCTVIASQPHRGELSEDAAAARADEARVTVLYGEPTEVQGHLGRFDVALQTPRGDALRAADLIVCDHLEQSARLGELRTDGDAGLDAVELGEVIAGSVPGRTSPDAVTVCDLTGTGAQDTAIATLAVARAREAGLGTVVQV